MKQLSYLLYICMALTAISFAGVTERKPNTLAKQGYDFIIVGGGTSGCVLAEKLSTCKEFSVLLIEGGMDQEKNWEQEYHTPMSFDVQNARGHCIGTYFDGYLQLATGTAKPARAVLTKYGFTEALGGSTALNDQIVTRGAKASWDAIGNGLDWKSVLPYFKKIENAQFSFGADTATRGIKGQLIIKNKPIEEAGKQLDAVKQSLVHLLNVPLIQDYNNGNPTGLSEAQYAVTEFSAASPVYGRRETSYKKFLVDNGAVHRPNLTILSGHTVSKITVESQDAYKHATGVMIQTSEGLKTITAHKEVILTAGALNTPMILLQSGIGPRAALDTVGIGQIADVPGVGENLHDHLFIGNVLFKDTTSYPAGYRPPQLLIHANSGVNAVEPVDAPDLEYVFTPTVTENDQMTHQVSWLVDIYITRHALRGKLALTSKVPGLQPCFPQSPHLPYAQGSDNFFPEIQTLLIKAVRFLEPLLDSPVLTYCTRPIGDDFKQLALVKNQTDEQKLNQFRNFFRKCTIENLNALGASLFVAHRFGGTCKIGDATDSHAVVNKELKVRGFDNLRIGDASILPLPIQSHMDVPMMMLGSKLGSMICKDHQSTYDFIIVGSGCAGTVLLSRLTEDPNLKVLCIDAGDYHRSFDDNAQKINGRTIDNIIPPQAIIDHLGGWQRYYPSQYGFGIKAPTHAYNNRIRSNPIFGGGSTINCSDYWRGGKWVFDYWASGLKLPGWSWDDVAPFHEKVEYALTNDGTALLPIKPEEWPGRGTQGQIAVEVMRYPPLDPNQLTPVQQIAAALTMPVFNDYQVPHYDRAGNLITQFVSYKQHNRTRVVTGYCDDLDVFARDNVTIAFKSPVARILFDHKNAEGKLHACGVITNDGKVYHARKEVIVNCGTLMSPKLLMLSGIGDAKNLGEVGIQPLINLPGVGKNLADHISPSLEWFGTSTLTNYGPQLRQQLKVLFQSHQKTFNNWPDFEVNIAYSPDPETSLSTLTMWTYGHLSPICGEMRLRSQDPSVDLEISGVHEIFDANGNIRAELAPHWIGLYRMWLSLFKKLNGIVIPNNLRYSQTALFVRDGEGRVKENPTDEEILESYKKAFVLTPSLFRYKSVLDKGHFMGTCRMGNRAIDPYAVVDHNFLVYGTNNLRVIDNSIIPSTPDGKLVVSPFGHPSAWLYMFGEKISAYLKEKYVCQN